MVSAVAQVYARARAMQLPITRIHSDRAREFSGGKFQKRCQDRDVFHTMTPGDEPQSNARAEREVAMIKQRMRVALKAANAPDHFWPLAFRFGVEQRHRQQLLTLGIQCPSMLPFGCKAVARKKTWHQRADPFKWPTLKVRLWGPASGMTASSNGYFVQDGEGKFFRTTVVHPHVDELKFQGEEDQKQQGQGDEDQQQAQGEVGLEPGEQLLSQQEEQPGSLPGGEEEEIEIEDVIEEKKEQESGHKGPGEREVKKIIEETSRSATIQDVINSFDILIEKAADKQFLAIVPHDQPRRRYLKKAPPKLEGGQPVVYKVKLDEWIQDTDPLPCSSSPAQHCNQSGAVTVNNGRGESELEEELEEVRKEVSFEHLLLNQHQSLTRWEVASEIVDGNASPEEVQCAIQARSEAGQMENLLKEFAIRRLEKIEENSEVLQTRTVGLEEVRRNLDEWKPAFEEEINNLSERAIERIGDEEFRKLLNGPREVECLPMKAVATLKPPCRHKGRVVVCGNYAGPRDGDQSDNSASGADSACVRSLLNIAMHRGWTAASIDIKAAFLQAPRRSASTKVTIGDPPSVLKAMNLVAPSEKWIIHQAMYGLVESPGDWGAHRDGILRASKWWRNDSEFSLVETPERHVWKVTQLDNPEAEHGYLLTYVDDMLIVGNKEVAQEVIGQIQGHWQCSPPEFLSDEKPMKFCGYDLMMVKDGLKISQEGYTRDLVARYGISQLEAVSLPKIEESEEKEEFSMADLRKAQSIVGELLWLSTKSRPDIAYGVGAIGRMVHQRPNYAYEMGVHILKYLFGTLEHGLIYRKCPQGDLGGTDQLQLPRSTSRIELYADISYSPSHEQYRSIQGILAEHGGNIILWESGRQPFTCHSTAESELVSYSEAHQIGESLAELLCVLGFPVEKLLYGDNKAALSAATMETGNWRTRHLRLRAHALRCALATPESKWSARHMSGKQLVADGLTKPLMGAAYMNFVEKLGLSSGAPTPAIRKVAAVGQGSRLVSGVVLSSLALLAMDQVVLAALVIAAGVLWMEGTRPKKANEQRPHKSLRRTGMEGHNPPRDEDEVAHPPSLNRLGTVKIGDSWSQTEKEVEGRSSGSRALKQAHEKEGSKVVESHGISSAGASCCGKTGGHDYVGGPRLCAFKGPAGSDSSAAARGRAAMAQTGKGGQPSTPVAVNLQVDALAEEMEVRLSVSQVGRTGMQSSHVSAGKQSSHVDFEHQPIHENQADPGGQPHWVGGSGSQQSMQENQADHGSQLHRAGGYGSQQGATGYGNESCGDSHAGGPWNLSQFQKPKSGSKDWWDMSLQAQGWAIRVHATWRTRPFHPVHKLTPINTSQMTVERTTVRFDGGERLVIVIDDWQDPACARGSATQQWKGFTFFRIKAESEDSNYGFEFVK